MHSGENDNIRIPKGHKLCPVCGKVKRLVAFSDGNGYCDRCREQMLYTALPWQYVLSVVLIIVVAAFSAVFLVKNAPIALYVMNASDEADRSSLSDAIDCIDSAQKVADDLNADSLGGFYRVITNN